MGSRARSAKQGRRGPRTSGRCWCRRRKPGAALHPPHTPSWGPGRVVLCPPWAVVTCNKGQGQSFTNQGVAVRNLTLSDIFKS